MNFSEVSAPSIAFVTSAWSRDWSIVLDPARYKMIQDSHCTDFPVRLVVLNNFESAADEMKATRAANRLLELGYITQVVVAKTVLTDEVLETFRIDSGLFWQRNPWFTTSHLASLYTLRDQAEWMVYQSGDVWLERPAAWLGRALKALSENPMIRGLNLCRNIYREHYQTNCDEETQDLWSSGWWGSRAGSLDNKALGFCLSDHAYLIPVNPAGGWDFGFTDADLEIFRKYWPPYAIPCFEMLYNHAMRKEGFRHAALKPNADGLPVTKHKSFPKKSPLKLWLYKLLGRYSVGGRLATAAK